jgi:hypothetical protein
MGLLRLASFSPSPSTTPELVPAAVTPTPATPAVLPAAEPPIPPASGDVGAPPYPPVTTSAGRVDSRVRAQTRGKAPQPPPDPPAWQPSLPANMILRPEQLGFCTGRGCIEHILTLRSVYEIYDLYAGFSVVPVFIDFAKAFDSLDRLYMTRSLVKTASRRISFELRLVCIPPITRLESLLPTDSLRHCRWTTAYCRATHWLLSCLWWFWTRLCDGLLTGTRWKKLLMPQVGVLWVPSRRPLSVVIFIR